MGYLKKWYMNKYPRTDFHELNQDWMITMLYDMINQVENFVEMNSVKYADPIQWNITRQYEKNTIVVDAITGTAYISSKPVPMGVALSRTEYWNVIFDLGRFITLASQNFANSYEAVLTTTATMPTDKDGWIVWNSLLYRAKNDIHIGDMYVVDGNIERYTVEMFFDELSHLIAEETEARIEGDNALHGEIVDESVARENADGVLQDNIDAEATSRENADSVLQDNIDAEATARENADDALQDNIDAEATVRENADDALNDKIGNLANLDTIFKGNVVGAINEVFNLPKGVYVNVRDFGAMGAPIYYDKESNRYYGNSSFTTQPPNDVSAFESAINTALATNKKYVYIPAGYYYLPNKTFGLSENLTFIGEGNTYLVSEGLTGDANFINITVTNDMLEYSASPTIISNITILGNYFNGTRKTNSNGVVAVSVGDAWVQHRNIVNVGVANFDVGFKFRAAVETHMMHCSVFLCNVGIAFNESNGGYNPVPFFFEDGTIELNGTAILAPNGGYSTVHIINSGFSGGRMAYYGKSNLYITGCRMEYAIDALCADDGTPNAAIEVYSTSGGDADSGLMIDNCEIVTTASGYWDAIDLFVNVDHHTRAGIRNYLYHLYQPYAAQSCDAMINNTLYNIGDAPISILCYAEGGRVTGKIRSTISANRGTMLGAFTLNAEALSKYSNITQVGTTGISVSADATVSIKLSTNDSGVIAHLPINDTIVHSYYCNGSLLSSTNITSSASNYYNANTCSKKPIGADEVRITVPDGYYGEVWIEVI